MSELNFIADKDKCIHCGLCESDCGAKIINLNQDKFPEIKPEDEKYCMECQHCLAICPAGAISICCKYLFSISIQHFLMYIIKS